MIKDATLSMCGLYRYSLLRAWDVTLRSVVWVMLNPSTADAMKPDHTMTKCVGFARSWNCGSIIIVNLFGLRSRDPKKLVEVHDPVGPYNHEYLRTALDTKNAMKVVAWGANPAVTSPGARTMITMVKNRGGRGSGKFQCLGYTQSGQPRHPLMLAYSTPLEPWPRP